MVDEDTSNNETTTKEESNSQDLNISSKKTTYTSGSSKEINYVATPHPMRRERSVNLQIFALIIVVDALLACLFIGVFWYLSMPVPMYIAIGVVSLVALSDLVFLLYTIIVYAKKVKREDERIQEERYQRMLNKEKEE